MKTDITWTTSKILAYLIVLIGTVYSFMYQEANVIMASFTSAGVVMAIKTFSQKENNDV